LLITHTRLYFTRAFSLFHYLKYAARVRSANVPFSGEIFDEFCPPVTATVSRLPVFKVADSKPEVYCLSGMG
jgi:hypothetical protein